MPTSLMEITARADTLYAARSEIENVRSSVGLLREAATSDYEAAWRLGRALFFLGQEAANESEARPHHVEGANASLHAVNLQRKRVEGHFWLGVNLALLAGLENPLQALFHALRAKRAIEYAVSIDEAYHEGGPLRVLARLQHKLPRWLGGGHRAARANFEKAIKLAPANTVTRIYFAEFLSDRGNRQEARAQLEAILVTPPNVLWAFEAERDRQLATELLAGQGVKAAKGKRLKG